MASTRPGVVVTGLTVGALAVVGLLAFQADGAQTRALAAKPSAGAGTATGSTASPSPGASQAPPQLPAASGTGLRVVYSLGSRTVWLVDPKKTPPVQAAFRVTPGTADPTAGNYTVYSRTVTTTGTDGLRIEHVVRFAQQNGTVFGFSAAVDTPSASPAPTPSEADPTRPKTGGIRSTRADGQTLWDFAPTGTRVVVVP
ncbi:L,D-transpeptidase [Kitasatospora sp. HPMI-4]|uniref:L,D-transpeptidase n=1 Tax=Kitasatospora sp. HPMI-4 TaxID=3448443 RepID=UPI003F1995DF